LTPYSAAAADSEGLVYCLRAVNKQGIELVRITADGKESVLHRIPEQKRGAKRTLVAAAPVIDSERGSAYCVVNLDEGSSLHAWSLSKNSVIWEHPLPHAVQGTPTVRHDGVVLVPDLAGNIHAVASDGTARFKYSCACDYLLAGAVSEAGGNTFIGDPLGRLHQIDPSGSGKVLFETQRSIQSRPSFDRHGSLYLASTDGKVYVFPGSRPGAPGQAR
jgi:hypothetical protein